MSAPRHGPPPDRGLQQERTSLAWERTGVAMMVAGVLLARYAAQDVYPLIAVAGVAQTAVGGGVLVWAGVHHEDLDVRRGQGVPLVHPAAIRVVGSATVVFTLVALALAVAVSVAP